MKIEIEISRVKDTKRINEMIEKFIKDLKLLGIRIESYNQLPEK